MDTVRTQEDVPVVGRCSKPTCGSLQLLPWTLLVLLAHSGAGECLGDALSASVGCECPWLRCSAAERGLGSQEEVKWRKSRTGSAELCWEED